MIEQQPTSGPEPLPTPEPVRAALWLALTFDAQGQADWQAAAAANEEDFRAWLARLLPPWAPRLTISTVERLLDLTDEQVILFKLHNMLRGQKIAEA